MARNSRRGGDRVLESRHLFGLFLGVVLLCGVFFTLGYVMGRTQYGGPVHAETLVHPSASPRAATAAVPKENAVAAPAPSEWDFYPSKSGDAPPPAPLLAKPEQVVSEVPQPETPVAEAPAPARPVVFSTKNRRSPPASVPARAAKGSIVLQVAALRHESDAVEMSRLLRQKKFPAFVSAPLSGEKFYRVQVGPYSDEHAADAAKAALDHAGFKAIIKH
jgi:DedD protein